jgi:hypothetical protein
MFTFLMCDGNDSILATFLLGFSVKIGASCSMSPPSDLAHMPYVHRDAQVLLRQEICSQILIGVGESIMPTF